jgi:hypothetical protein
MALLAKTNNNLTDRPNSITFVVRDASLRGREPGSTEAEKSTALGVYWPIVHLPRMIREGGCGVIGGANDDCRGNRSTRRKPAQRHFVSPQIPHA